MQKFTKNCKGINTKAAETTKLLENVFRAVNIGLVNELKIFTDKLGLNIYEIIEAAATKPFGFMPFTLVQDLEDIVFL